MPRRDEGARRARPAVSHRAMDPGAPRRRAMTAAAAASVALVLASCAFDGRWEIVITDACPAIGYSSALVVYVDDPTGDASDVRICENEGCEPPEDRSAPDRLGANGGIDADATDGRVDLGIVGGEATLGMLVSAPSPLWIDVLDEGGRVLSTARVEPDYIRIDGTERCGGNRRADVTVAVP